MPLFPQPSGNPNQIPLVNDEAGTVSIGAPVYSDAAGGFKLAKADAAATGSVIGITALAIASAHAGSIQTNGPIVLTTAQWDAICGTVGGLAFNVPYYLDAATAGKLTATPPSVAGEVVQQVIVGVSPTTAIVKISTPIVIGSGANVIQLRNDNAGAMLIGQPIYSDAAAGMDLGVANNTGKSNILGLVVDATIAHLATGNVAVGGIMVATTVQWDVVCGTVGGLTFNTPYYLDPATPGKLTSVAPVTSGQEVVQVIVGMSPTLARIAIQPPILL